MKPSEIYRKAARMVERDEVYTGMFEGEPQTTLTLGTRAARLEEAMAHTVARQLNAMFPGHKWEVMAESAFRYKAAAA